MHGFWLIVGICMQRNNKTSLLLVTRRTRIVRQRHFLADSRWLNDVPQTELTSSIN